MPTRKTKPAKKPAKKVAKKPSRPAASSAAKKAVKRVPRKKAVTKAAVAKPKAGKKTQPLDVSGFPPESISVFEKWICLACVSDVFTRHLDLAPRTAHLEIK